MQGASPHMWGAKFLKCSRDKDRLQTRLAFKEMKTKDGA